MVQSGQLASLDQCHQWMLLMKLNPTDLGTASRLWTGLLDNLERRKRIQALPSYIFHPPFN
jgi:hypothetical protein